MRRERETANLDSLMVDSGLISLGGDGCAFVETLRTIDVSAIEFDADLAEKALIVGWTVD